MRREKAASISDLATKKATATLSVGADPDVLAFDPGLHRLYVSAESGVISVVDERDRSLQKIGEVCLLLMLIVWQSIRARIVFTFRCRTLMASRCCESRFRLINSL